MTVHVVALAAIAPQPWRNGGGVTRELLAWPPGSGADWQVRVSVADIERDGPFSAYPDVQRCFAVLEGAGVVLGMRDGERTLTTASEPLTFDGAEAPACRLVNGPTRDLNLMVRSDAGRATMRGAPAGSRLAAQARWRALYLATPAQWQRGTEPPAPLAAHTLVWSDAADEPAWHVHAHGAALRAWWLTVALST